MAKATITIEDISLDDGTVKTTVLVEGTAIDDGYVTAANFFALHIRDCMSDPTFLAAVWAKAETIMKDNPGASIVNPDQKIEMAANDTDTAQVA